MLGVLRGSLRRKDDNSGQEGDIAESFRRGGPEGRKSRGEDQSREKARRREIGFRQDDESRNGNEEEGPGPHQVRPYQGRA